MDSSKSIKQDMKDYEVKTEAYRKLTEDIINIDDNEFWEEEEDD